ncbi:M20 family metallopeptidase [Nocardia sp. NPDC051832]|uniref:M20 family metallopeptidase n=1 Tax=Nocardia sp. NPDC051832 TaxID=3155673 RepID=UPI00343E8B77
MSSTGGSGPVTGTAADHEAMVAGVDAAEALLRTKGRRAVIDTVPAGRAVVDAWLAEHAVDLVGWRRHIHANPELSRTEFGTTEFISSWLTKAGLNPQKMPGGTGLICDIGPSDGPRIGLRADMDALPLQEFTGLSFASTVPGVSHACGHDAHTTILLGTALALSEMNLPVGVRFVFQPAEEVMPGGAIDMVAAGAMEGVDRIFALHCDPRLEVGRVGIRVGAITSAADTVELVLDSPGGHTSRPHLTSDLVYAIGTVITGLPGLLSRRIDPRTSTVMVWGAVSAGKAPNAIPQTGMLTGTVRTGDHATWSLLEPMVHEIVDGLLAPTGVRYQLNYRRGVPPVVNDEQSTRMFESAIRALGPDALADTMQSGGGEDFSWYLEEVPGAMARLGVWSGRGEQLDLHQPTFDIDERALSVGVRVLSNIILQAG